jgi:hypothetical protein
MNKRKVEKLIPSAIDALISCGVVKDGKHPKEFKGYISALGASIVQAGLLTTVINYEKVGGGESADKPKVIKAIYEVLKVNKMLTDVDAVNDESFTKYLLNRQRNGIKEFYATERQIKKMTGVAATALKTAIRTFKQKDDE